MLKVISLLLIALVVNLATAPSPVFADSKDKEKANKHAEKVKTEIAKLGAGTDSKVQVKLKDGTKLKGYVSEINDEGFVVTDKTGKSTVVPYNHAKQVGGKNTKLGIIVLVGIAAFLIILIATQLG